MRRPDVLAPRIARAPVGLVGDPEKIAGAAVELAFESQNCEILFELLSSSDRWQQSPFANWLRLPSRTLNMCGNLLFSSRSESPATVV
jgi:hypothetical protein